MKTSEIMTNFPLQITFRNISRLAEAELWIRVEAAKLETFYNRIMGCRLAVESPHRHHKEGIWPGGGIPGISRRPADGARNPAGGDRRL